jgi:outer membrane lipoprotein-sorting protein
MLRQFPSGATVASLLWGFVLTLGPVQPTLASTTPQTDEALTAMAAALRNATRLRFDADLVISQFQGGQSAPIGAIAYQFEVQRPNSLRVSSKTPGGINIVATPQNITILDGQGGAPIVVNTPDTYPEFIPLLPTNLPPAEKQLLSTVLNLLGNNPAGFLAGEATERVRYAHFTYSGIEGDMYKLADGKTETLLGLRRIQPPVPIKLTIDLGKETNNGVILNFSFVNWDIVTGVAPPGTPASSGNNPANSTSTKPSATPNREGIRIEPAKRTNPTPADSKANSNTKTPSRVRIEPAQ